MNNLLSKFTYGLYTLSSGDNICIIDTAMQITSAKSKDLMIAISINNNSDTGKLIKEGEYFSIGILSYSTPISKIEQFGFGHSSEKNKYEGIHYTVLDGVNIPFEYLIGCFILQPVNQIEYEDHTLVIGKVIDYKEYNSGEEPKTYQDYLEEKASKN